MNVETSDGERSAGYSSWLSIGDILFNKTQQPKIDKLTFPKQTVNTFTQTHTHTLLCICFSSRRSTFHPCVEVEGLCPDMSGQELKICDACTQRERAATQAKQIKYPRSYRAAGLPKK